MSSPPPASCPALPGTTHHPSSQGYHYPHLDPSCREIRLLTLHPANHLSSPILCSLAVHSLDASEDPRAYEALSYVWGDPLGPRHPITLDDTAVTVAANLHTALQFLRHPAAAARTLWIDALCVNQECVAERERQVGLMSAIFSGAETVLAWLGHPSDDGLVNPDGEGIRIGDAMARALAEEAERRDAAAGSAAEEEAVAAGEGSGGAGSSHLHSRFGGPHRASNVLAWFMFLRRLVGEGARHAVVAPFFETVVDEAGREKVVVDRRFERAFKAFEMIVDSAWWDRIWTVQEAMLAKKLWLVHFHLIIPFDDLASEVNVLNRHALSCCAFSLDHLPGEQSYIFRRLIRKVLELKQGWEGARWAGLTRPGLAFHLKKFRSRRATDPRDKINALLGLSEWKQAQPITPSYSIGLTETYVNATMRLIEEEKSLDILEGHGSSPQYTDLTAMVLAGLFHIGSRAGGNLPSWVPDWTLPHTSNFDNFVWLYNAGDSLSKAELCCDLILMVRGVDFDTITSVGNVCECDTDEEVWPVLRGWANMLIGDPFAHKAYPTGQSQSDAFKCTMSGDVVRKTASDMDGLPYDYARAGDTLDGRLRGWDDESDDDIWYYDPTDESKADWMQHVNDIVIPKVVHNRFFLTKYGCMGIGPSETAVGDKVFVLRGGRLPFILRHSNELEHGRTGCHHPPELCFRLVGRSYVHGIMDGQALKDDQMVERDVHLY